MKPLIFNLGTSDALFDGIVSQLNAERGVVKHRSFPDGESYIRFDSDCRRRQTIIVCSLDQPNAKVLPLLLAADTLHDLGASDVGLICPYLAYMRQDTRFQPGEGITARFFASILSHHFDWLVTVDPHLHRFHAMNEIYTIPTRVVHAASRIAEWVANNIENPVLIGPDSESRQWVAEVAAKANAPYVVLNKVRSGDRDVAVSVPNVDAYQQCVPVLVDDIVSTGSTLVATVEHLLKTQMEAPVCVAVHGIFVRDALEALYEAGAAQVVTCNTIEHPTNKIDLSIDIAEAVNKLLFDRTEQLRYEQSGAV